MALPLFGFFTRPVSISFASAAQPMDILALQVGIQRVPPLDQAVFSSGIPSISVESYWGNSHDEQTWPATQTVALNYNSSGSPEDQAADKVLQGPGTTIPMYGVETITSAMVGANWLWAQGPGCQSGSISTHNTYEVRGYLFYNLTAIKKVQSGGYLELIVNMEGCSGSTYQVGAESLHAMSSVWFGAANSLRTLGGTALQNAASMPWSGEGMYYWAKGVGTPDTDATDAISPKITVAVDLAASDYSITMSGSGFGGTSPNVFSYTSGAGPD